MILLHRAPPLSPHCCCCRHCCVRFQRRIATSPSSLSLPPIPSFSSLNSLPKMTSKCPPPCVPPIHISQSMGGQSEHGPIDPDNSERTHAATSMMHQSAIKIRVGRGGNKRARENLPSGRPRASFRNMGTGPPTLNQSMAAPQSTTMDGSMRNPENSPRLRGVAVLLL